MVVCKCWCSCCIWKYEWCCIFCAIWLRVRLCASTYFILTFMNPETLNFVFLHVDNSSIFWGNLLDIVIGFSTYKMSTHVICSSLFFFFFFLQRVSFFFFATPWVNGDFYCISLTCSFSFHHTPNKGFWLKLDISI